MEAEPSGESELSRVCDRLREVQYAGSGVDVIAYGFVREVELDRGVVTVRIVPEMRAGARARETSDAIKHVLGTVAGVSHVVIQRSLPLTENNADEHASTTNGGGRPMTPLQAEMLDGGVVPEADVMGAWLARPDIAPAAGYTEDGPRALGGELPTVPATTGLPVFQWEIDPLDPTLEAHEVSLDLDGWEFSIWWQVHPAELLYVSIQALRDDRADGNRGERGHPIGRNVVANLVFDRRRGGVVAVYGTTHDFRPFIEAFKRAYDAKQTEQNR